MPILSLQQEGVQTSRTQIVALERLFCSATSSTQFLRDRVVWIVQNIGWVIGRFLFWVFVDYKIHNVHILKTLKKPLIIVANHKTYLDPFFIGWAFPIFSRAYPIYFATAPQYYYNIFLYLLAFFAGSFPVKKGIGLKNSLRFPVDMLKNGGTVCIFPEGKVLHYGRPTKGRRGAAFLALSTHAAIVPMRIEASKYLTFFRFLLRQVKITIYIGDPFIYSDHEEITAEVLNKKSEEIIERIHAIC